MKKEPAKNDTNTTKSLLTATWLVLLGVLKTQKNDTEVRCNHKPLFI
jgi:hypothetical protein